MWRVTAVGTRVVTLITVLFCLVSNGAIADAESGPQNALQQAAALHSQGKYSEAIPILQQGLALAGTDKTMVEQLKSYLAFCYTALGDIPNAIQVTNELVSEFPDNPRWLLQRATCYQKQGKHTDVIAVLEPVLQTLSLPKDAEVMKYSRDALAKSYLASEQWGKAIAMFQLTADNYPEWKVDHLGQVAHCYGCQKKWNEAIAILENILTTPSLPKDKEKGIKDILLAFYTQNKQFEEAVDLCQSLASEYPNESYYPYWLGMHYQSLGDYGKAISYYEDIVERLPNAQNLGDVYNAWAGCLNAQGKLSEAVAMLGSAAEAKPEAQADLLFYKAEMLDDYVKDYNAAMALLNQIISENPGSNRSTVKQAMVKVGTITLWKLWKPVEARATFTDLLARAETLGLDKAELNYHLAYCSYVEKDYSKARAEFQSVCDTYPKSIYFVSALFMVGDCSAKIGDNEGARNAFEKVISDFPDNQLAGSAAKRLTVLSSNRQPEFEPVAKPDGVEVARLVAKEEHINVAK